MADDCSMIDQWREDRWTIFSHVIRYRPGLRRLGSEKIAVPQDYYKVER